MKKNIIILSILALCALKPMAQNVELSIMSGYQFLGKSNTTKGEMKLTEGVNLHANLQVGNEDGGFQLLYIYQPTALSFHPYGSFSNPQKLTDVNAHYIMGGGNFNINPDADVVLYGGLLVGLGILDPKESQYYTIHRMTFGLDAGLKAELTDYIGLKLQSTLLLPVQYTGAGVVVASNGASYGTTAAGSVFLQINVDAGIMISF